MTFDRKIYFPDDGTPVRADDTPAKPAVQRWKTDPKLYNCEREHDGKQAKKKMDYHQKYVKEFLDSDPIRDWESIERCIALWMFFLTEINIVITDVYKKKWDILDCGTKDGQFPEWLSTQGINSLGTEISMDYVKWAKDKNRNVEYGDVCNMPEDWTDKWDVVFSHHLLGLVSDYWKGLEEMYRVTKPGGYLVTLNDVPGNPKKHYSYIGSEKIFNEFTKSVKSDIIYNGRWHDWYPKEWLYITKKNVK